ncbi:hypothetical protein PANDA_011912 [Ailuropoda melanoleuca]|uniref:GDP-mannose 4,6-dehydratase n=1 Tax=Ailuropoda melanoleuca TaxID=9646 RepID=D2HKJ6_AILME|nr:hypothetical protein PANDA_011912 [Ailuropoda melanoleuca]
MAAGTQDGSSDPGDQEGTPCPWKSVQQSSYRPPSLYESIQINQELFNASIHGGLRAEPDPTPLGGGRNNDVVGLADACCLDTVSPCGVPSGTQGEDKRRPAGLPRPETMSLRSAPFPTHCAAQALSLERPGKEVRRNREGSDNCQFSFSSQDGSYLAEFLLEKGYEVHGIVRRSSSFNTGRIEHLYKNPQAHIEGRYWSGDAAQETKSRHAFDHPSPGVLIPSNMKLHYGDLTDSTCLVKIINEVKPTEIYNLGAQSHVKGCHRDLKSYGLSNNASYGFWAVSLDVVGAGILGPPLPAVFRPQSFVAGAIGRNGVHAPKIHMRGCSTSDKHAFRVRWIGSPNWSALCSLDLEPPQREWLLSQRVGALNGGDKVYRARGSGGPLTVQPVSSWTVFKSK